MLFGVWFWSLGALPAEIVPATVLAETAGDVKVKTIGSEVFALAASGMELHAGDTVKTGPASSALIRFFDKAESKLDEKTEFTLVESSDGEDEGDETMRVRVHLEAGRAWSRVRQILDLNGEFVAETSDVVATVRGTSFDIEKVPSQKTRLWVAESVIDASPGSEENALFIAEGYMAEFKEGQASATGTQLISKAGIESEWFRNNRAADKQFQENYRTHLTEFLALNRVPRTGLLKDVVRSSELLRQSLGSQDSRKALELRYLLRRLAIIHRDAVEGNAGSAFREYTRLENSIRMKAESDEDAKQIRRVLMRAHLLFIDVLPEDPAYRLKQQLEELILQLSADLENEFSARFIAVGARLDESIRLFDESNFDAAKSTALVAKTALENLSRELPLAKLDTDVHPKLMRILLAYRVRTEALLQRIEEQEKIRAMPVLPSPVFVTSTDALLTPTSTEATGACIALRVTASMNPVAIGDESRITVRAVYADGRIEDVTRESSVKLVGTNGALQGNVFIAAQIGSSRIEATASCGQETRTQSTDLVVYAPNLPESLEMVPNQATLFFLQSIPFQVRVRYTNGETKDVTAQTVFHSSDERIGIQNGATFTAFQLPGVVQITGSYAEQGVSVEASATMTVKAPQ